MAEPGRPVSVHTLGLAVIAGLALMVPASGAGAATSRATRTTAAATALLQATKGAAAAAAAKTSHAGSTSTTTTTTTTSSTASTPARTTAPAATSTPLAGWLGNGTIFPQRAIVLYPPPGTALNPGQVHLAENGTAVAASKLTATTRAGAGDFGVTVVVDQNSTMAGGPLKAVVNAVRGLAAQRTAQQELGVVTFAATPSVLLPTTSDAPTITSGLAATPGTAPGADVPAATSLALAELARVKVALGAIVVISDGAGRLVSAHGPTAATVQAAAAAVRVPVFTVGLQDAASSPASMSALRAASPGQFISVTPAQLPGALHTIMSTLTRGYVLRYASRQPPGHQVAATVTATRVPGTVDIGYRAPGTLVASPRARVHPAAPAHAATPAKRVVADFSHTTPLSPRPSFASPHPRTPAPAPTTAASFWNSSASMPIVAGTCGLLIAIGLALLFYRPSTRAVRLRVGSFTPEREDVEDALELTSRRHVAPRLFRFGTWWAPFVHDVEIARSSHSPIDLVKRAGLVAIVLAALAEVVTGSVLAALAPLLLWPIPLRTLMKRGARKQREVFGDALPGYLQDLASAMRVGRSFAGALAVVAASADEPVHSELERAVTDEALGRPIDVALEDVARRMQDTDLDQVALIASLNRRSGSNVAEALDRVADGARDRADLRREIKALTAQAKMSSWVLTALPPLLLIGIAIISPLYSHPLFHTKIGIALMVLASLMVFAGWKVMKKITAIKA